MKKNLIFIHQNYPAQFGPISRFLTQNYDINVSFFSQHKKNPIAPGISHFSYTPARTGHEENPYFFSRYFEQECAAMHGVYAAIANASIEAPDLFVSHVAFGNLGLLHVEYPDVPKIGFFELFYDPFGRNSTARPEFPSPKPNCLRVPLRNATSLVELEYCTKGYSPTPFQKSTFPDAYQGKLSVLFDGIVQ